MLVEVRHFPLRSCAGKELGEEKEKDKEKETEKEKEKEEKSWHKI